MHFSNLNLKRSFLKLFPLFYPNTPANTLKKLADILDTTVDYLVSGDKDEKAKASLKDAELLLQFKAVDQFTDEDKIVIKKLIDAFIVKKQLQQMAS